MSPSSHGAAEPIACDTGPGNALIDDLMLARTGVPLDRDGATAAHGTVDEAALALMLAHPFFRKPPPKSLDRNDFSLAAVDAPLDAGRRGDADRLHRRLGAEPVSVSATPRRVSRSSAAAARAIRP